MCAELNEKEELIEDYRARIDQLEESMNEMREEQYE
mgnify:CR=1 FL=1|jgi:hypothetical protein